MKLSAIIITFNEAHNIVRCLEALQTVADEVVVVDSFSKDNTLELAQSMGARVLQHPFEGYGTQKSFAIQAASYDWILSIDADEVLSPTLQDSILSFKQDPKYDACLFNNLTNYCGAWIRHCGWYPNQKIRLLNKTKGHMTMDQVHEGFEMQKTARTCILKGDLYHYSFPTISSHLKKVEHYSEVGARFDVARGKRVSIFKLLLSPGWTFFSLFILRGGILDGYYGYVICRISAFASFAKYLKIRQYTAMKKRGEPF
ncbi:MAG: glycosyltransferase family 2 protein [Bacteroidetes bacterium]|nr:glycosyltransferase family 2 protein [Bacteroidota bacterium]